MLNHLYGDGIHDDTLAIQEMIDSAGCELSLPVPDRFYLISRPLELPSNFRLILPRFAEVRLAAGANCVMVKNKLTRDPNVQIPDGPDGWPFEVYATAYASSRSAENIELTGGIWNCNNMEQNPNPIQSQDFSVHEFWGYGMLFYKVRGLKLSSLTIKDPTNFGVTMDTVSYFTIENITFDYNLGNPKPINMDGLHFNGNCHFGMIRNLMGSCYDDLVALNADEGTAGPITNVTVDGIFAEECHSAVRLLTVKQRVENIHISNVYGTYYQYCIGITNYFYAPDSNGFYDGITLDHIYASKAIRHPHLYPRPNSYVYALIWIDRMTRIKNLKINTLHRVEYNNPIATLCVRPDTVIDRLILEDITTENHTDAQMPLIVNDGTIRRLILRDVAVNDEQPIINQNIIEETIAD